MNLFGTTRVFLDYASTTPVLPEVEKEMKKYWTKVFHNPSAIYAEGMSAHQALNEMRTKIARILHVQARDVIFTASGTEADNLALLGVFEKFRTEFKPHIIISSIEHPAIQEAAKEVERRGGEVTTLLVDESGRVSPQAVIDALQENTVLVSVMYANNEIGTVEPVGKIARLLSEYKKKHGKKFPYFHTDASQAANYLPLDIAAQGVDMMTLDASKLYGPKGVGLLVVRPHVEIHPIIFGGGQERGLRSGTESLALIAGFAEALSIAERDKEKESERIGKMKRLLIERITKEFPEAIIHTPEDSLPNIVSVSFPGKLSEFIAIKLDREGVMVSTGSTCGTGKDEGGSQTIRAIGKNNLAESTLRLSFGRHTHESDIIRAVDALKRAVK